tara:strand:- start:104 stop:1408 length:1305 start_codon:yes stop_codon:yes gene_type:complete
MKIFKIQFFLITLLSLFSFQTINASGLEYIKVETEGTGVSVREAIDSALIQAIERVNGKSMESSTLLKTTEKLEETNKDSNYYSSQEYQDEIKSKTKGQIKEYKILSQNQMPDTSLWVVRVNATIAKYKVSKSAKRKRIAALPLQARPDCCNMMGVGTNPVFASEELSRGLSNALVQSRKFTVLDRDYIAERSSEKNVLSGDVPSEELAKLGQELFSDYILVGTITTAKAKEVTKTMRTNNMTFKEMQGVLQVSYRIIDVPTSQVKFSSNATINVTNSDLKKEGVSNQNSPAEIMYAVINVGAKKIGENILNAIFPILVESIKGKVVVLGQGGESIRRGQQMQLILRGDKIVDSYTKESLGRSEEVIGTIKITSVTPKQAYGNIVSTTKENLEALFKPKMMLVRPFTDDMNKEAQKEKIKKKRAEQKKKFDDDW